MGRKWMFAVWGMILGSVVTAFAVIGWLVKIPGAAGILGQGVAIVTLVLGMYSAANVTQKGVISRNYVAELDEQNK